MKYTILKSGGYSRGLSQRGDAVFMGGVLLSRLPEEALEASNAKYVTDQEENLKATAIIREVFHVDRLPSFSGDLIKDEGNVPVSLKQTGVTPGTYPKVTVNLKGLVVAGSSINPADLPSVSFSKVTNRPSTVSGYGINGVLTNTNSVMTGTLKVNGLPVYDFDAVTKLYVDTNLTIGDRTGNITYTTKVEPGNGFLRCNGGVISKSMYSDLYAAIGDQFTPSAILGTSDFGLPLIEMDIFGTEAFIRV